LGSGIDTVLDLDLIVLARTVVVVEASPLIIASCTRNEEVDVGLLIVLVLDALVVL